MDDQYITGKPASMRQSLHIKQIADLLQSQGLGFDYQRPTLVIQSHTPLIVYPDFTLHFPPLIIDYCPHPERTSQQKRLEHKSNLYHQNHLDALFVYPCLFSCGWQKELLSGIEQKLENQLDRYRHLRLPTYSIPPNRVTVGMLSKPYQHQPPEDYT